MIKCYNKTQLDTVFIKQISLEKKIVNVFKNNSVRDFTDVTQKRKLLIHTCILFSCLRKEKGK